MTIPEHGFLDDSGGNWKCDWGYRKGAASCALLIVPANAHIGISGDEWQCNTLYRRLQNECVEQKP
jgi:hypothetical protein